MDRYFCLCPCDYHNSSSLGGANSIGTKAAWALIGTGGAVAGLVIAGTTTNHLLFVKYVGESLPNSAMVVWQNANRYAGFPDSTSDGLIQLYGDGATIYAKRYAVCNSESIEFYIDFYRTRSISEERTA